MNYQCKCGSMNMFTEKKGNNTGLYCSECGKFQKWMGKNELRAFEYKQKEKEISKIIDGNLNNIYKKTNMNIIGIDSDTINKLNEFIDVLDEEMDRQLTRKSLGSMDEVSKCSYAHAYKKVKASLINIVNGRRYDEYE